MSKSVYQTLQRLLLMSTLIVLCCAYYFQYIGGLTPCPLCLVQRFCAILFGLFVVMGLYLARLSYLRWTITWQAFFALAGLFFASRQIWIQSLPADQVPACLPGLDVLMKYYPLHDVITTLFWGTRECAEQSWHFLGLSMPGWAACYFLVMFLVSAALFYFLNPLVHSDS